MNTTPNTLRAAVGAPPAMPAAEPRDPYQAFKRKLEASKAEFLPLFGGSQSNVDAFIRVVLNAVLANPNLLEADRQSLIVSCMKAAQDGLVPDGREAVLNIYRVNAARRSEPERWVPMVQYLPMVGGLIKLLYASGEVLSLDAAVVFQNDKFRFVRGDNPSLEHEPTLADDPGTIIAAYCVVKLRNGETKREVMPWRDIAMVRGASKSAEGENSPWVKWLDQMAIKSVIKRIYKQLPKTDKFDQVDTHDDQAMGFAATPNSVTDIATRSYAPVPAAITHQPADTIDFGIPDQRETIDAGQRTDDTQQRRQHTEEDRRPAFNEAAFSDRVTRCAQLDALDMMEDDLRSIADEGIRGRLGAVINSRRAVLAQPAERQPQTAAPANRRAAPAQRAMSLD